MTVHNPASQCRDKLRHPTKRAAQAAKRSIKSRPFCRHPEAMAVYLCPHCGFYHVGTRRDLVNQENAA